MRDRVVGVDDVQIEGSGHLHQLVGQRQQVLGLAEEWISWSLDLVKRQPGLELTQAERRLGAHQSYLMPAPGKHLG